MGHIKYQIQFDKIVNAYMQNKMTPLKPCGCFIGNLLNNNENWIWGRALIYNSILTPFEEEQSTLCLLKEAQGMYTIKEIIDIEATFLNIISGTGDSRELPAPQFDPNSKGYEERLFKGMEAALEHLKKLHQEKGEVIEDNPIFSKRELVEA